MSKFIDITGKRFNSLVVIKRLENAKGGVVRWECLCDCGNITAVRGSNLKNGAVKSCGCRREDAGKLNSTHGMSKSKLYRKWAGMKQRCYNNSIASFKDYGGRGIKVCNEWKDSFETFRDWALSHGYSDDLTIERIDTEKDYCPNNCMWIPFNKQQGNRRICYSFVHNGESKNLADWCRDLNLDYYMVHNRIYKLGWSFEKAISEPVHKEKRNKRNGRIHEE